MSIGCAAFHWYVNDQEVRVSHEPSNGWRVDTAQVFSSLFPGVMWCKRPKPRDYAIIALHSGGFSLIWCVCVTFPNFMTFCLLSWKRYVKAVNGDFRRLTQANINSPHRLVIVDYNASWSPYVSVYGFRRSSLCFFKEEETTQIKEEHMILLETRRQ